MVFPQKDNKWIGGIMLLVLQVAAFILTLIIRHMSEEDIISEAMDKFDISRDWAQDIFDWIS